MRFFIYLCIICIFKQVATGQSQGVTNSQTKLRPNQIRWSPTDATLDSVYIIRADTATGEPGWYLVTLGGSGGGVADTTLSGDVIGGLNSTFVRKINGVTVENKTPQTREVLTYNGTQWSPDSIDLADLPQLAQSVLLGRGSASTGIPQAISLGTGLSMSGTTLSNSSPDQAVSITGGGINTVTGTYPNFTVTGTEVDGSTTNEIQTLSRPLTGTLRLTKNGASDFVNLPDSSASNELQTLSTGTNSLTLSQSGGTVTVDTDPANEIQTIDTLTVASGLLRLKLSGSAVKTLATSNFATSPAGATKQVQYNNAGVFGANDSIVMTSNPDRLGIGVLTPAARIDIQGSSPTTNAIRIGSSTGSDLMVFGNNGKVSFTNGAVTSSSTNDAILGITGFTHTANSGSTNYLWGLNIDGTQVFNTANQGSGGLRIKLATNATTSQYNVPLYIESNSATEGDCIITNTSNTSGTRLTLKRGTSQTDQIVIQPPNSSLGGAVEGAGITMKASGTSGSVGYRNNTLTFAHSSSSSNTQTVDPTMVIKDKRIQVGQYPSTTPVATMDIRGEGATSSTIGLSVRNSSGTYAFKIKDDSQVEITTNTEASKSSLLLSGTGFSGGTATTTKPTLLIEPTGTTSTGWSTSGTKLGVNAESGFTGRYLDIQLAGVSKFNVQGDKINMSTSKTPSSSTDTGTTGDICWDSNYIYVCVATNTWKRTAITTW